VLYLRTATARGCRGTGDDASADPNRPLAGGGVLQPALVAFDNVILYEELHEANIRLEERVRERTHALTTANSRLSAQWSRLRRANEFKSEISAPSRTTQESARVILGRAEMLNELAAWSQSPSPGSGPAQPYPQLGRQLTEMVNELISDAMMDTLDIASAMNRSILPPCWRKS